MPCESLQPPIVRGDFAPGTFVTTCEFDASYTGLRDDGGRWRANFVSWVRSADTMEEIARALRRIEKLMESRLDPRWEAGSERKWLTTHQAAAYLGMKSSGVRSLVARGELVPDGRGPRGTHLFRTSTLDEFLVGRAGRSGTRYPHGVMHTAPGVAGVNPR